ncbi:MAG: ABC transporter permease [Lachnospiraceae bacterium]|nr:ABC transporter permease [Lachnospiraceae bacterium]
MGLVIHNLKKQKSQFLSFGIMVCITALIVNTALVLAFQTGKAYDKSFAEKNTAAINVLIPAAVDNDGIEGEMNKIEGVLSVERHEGVFTSATVREFAGSDFDMNTVFYNLEGERSVNLLEVSEDAGHSEKSVYVPEYMIRLGGFNLGDEITYSIGDKDYTFSIGGSVSEMQYGNYGTGLIGAYLPQKAYEEFASENSGALTAEYSMMTADNVKLSQVRNEIAALCSNKGIPLLNIGDKDAAKQTRTMVCTLLIVVFLCLAAIIFMVNIFLCNFRIKNSIEDEMTNMGVLKAIGYTSGMIITSNVVPYTMVGAASSAIGAALSYTILPFVADILAAQSGFSFAPVFDVTALCLTIIFSTGLILLFTYISAGKIRLLEPIIAIRGIMTAGTAKNHFPLEDSKMGIKFTRVLKQISQSAGQNLLLFVLSFCIMVLLSFAGTLFYNVSINPDNFMDTLSEESPSVIFAAADGKMEELKKELAKDSRVKEVLEYAQTPVSYEEGSLTCFVSEDFSLVKNDICYEGKNPAGDDEAAVGSALAGQYAIGDSIEIINGSKAHTYTVTGFIQSVNNNGMVLELTGEGYERISENKPNTLNVYLAEASAETFISEWEAEYPDDIANAVNYEQLAENGQRMYAGIVSAVTVVLFIISVLVVLLVMYIIINSMLTRRRQEFGIYKAIGYSNRQLLLQSAGSFVPVIAVAAILSVIAGLMYLPAMNNAIFSLLGAMKNHFEISLGFLFILALLFIAVSFIICIVLAMPMKRITAYSLLKE